MKHLSTWLLSSLILLPSAAGAAEPALPAGAYTLDKAHSTLTFDVSHVGFSRYTMSFDDLDATLNIDPAHPENAKVEVKIDPRSLDLPHPPEGFTKELLGDKWLKADAFPQITFTSDKIVMTGENKADIQGTLELLGVKQPLTLAATFNGGYADNPYDHHARMGFSATAQFKRSTFGVTYGIPEPGSTMGVGDEVKVRIETEFSGPGAKASEPAAK